MKIPPLITADTIDDRMAIEILENAIFSMSMSDDLNNTMLCLLAAMKRGAESMKRAAARREAKAALYPKKGEHTHEE